MKSLRFISMVAMARRVVKNVGAGYVECLGDLYWGDIEGGEDGIVGRAVEWLVGNGDRGG